MSGLSREQEGFLSNLALQHGRVCVQDGYADHSVRMTTPSLVTYVVDEDATNVREQRGTNYINWSET